MLLVLPRGTRDQQVIEPRSRRPHALKSAVEVRISRSLTHRASPHRRASPTLGRSSRGSHRAHRAAHAGRASADRSPDRCRSGRRRARRAAGAGSSGSTIRDGGLQKVRDTPNRRPSGAIYGACRRVSPDTPDRAKFSREGQCQAPCVGGYRPRPHVQVWISPVLSVGVVKRDRNPQVWSLSRCIFATAGRKWTPPTPRISPESRQYFSAKIFARGSQPAAKRHPEGSVPMCPPTILSFAPVVTCSSRETSQNPVIPVAPGVQP